MASTRSFLTEFDFISPNVLLLSAQAINYEYTSQFKKFSTVLSIKIVKAKVRVV